MPAILDGPQHRLFTPDEHAFCRRPADPAPRYAACWCTREAVVKALAADLQLTLRDVAVVGLQGHEPDVRFAPGVELPPGARILVSVGFTERVVVAGAVYLGGALFTPP